MAPWLERDNKGTWKPVPPGTKRTFASIQHEPGNSQVEIHFVDDETAKAVTPDIVIEVEGKEQPLELVFHKTPFTMSIRGRDGKEIIYEYRVNYWESKKVR